jgi:hypothetical protein
MFAASLASFSPAPPVTHGAYVRHGSLEVPRGLERDFELAEAYLGRDSVMRTILDKAEHGTHRIRLSENARDNDSFDASTRTVHWDPHSALFTSEGGRQSAALGLGHELDHATVGERIRERGGSVIDILYDTEEERRVIRGSEAHAARTLGEAQRHDHGGRSYWVSSPVVV